MLTLMADHDVEGQMQVLLRVLTSAEWHALWTELAVRVESLASLGMPTHTPDAILWQFCQTQQAALLSIPLDFLVPGAPIRQSVAPWLPQSGRAGILAHG
jgi:hypothetical protein